jgi:hypothetical protein
VCLATERCAAGHLLVSQASNTNIKTRCQLDCLIAPRLLTPTLWAPVSYATATYFCVNCTLFFFLRRSAWALSAVAGLPIYPSLYVGSSVVVLARFLLAAVGPSERYPTHSAPVRITIKTGCESAALLQLARLTSTLLEWRKNIWSQNPEDYCRCGVPIPT